MECFLSSTEWNGMFLSSTKWNGLLLWKAAIHAENDLSDVANLNSNQDEYHPLLFTHDEIVIHPEIVSIPLSVTAVLRHVNIWDD